MVRNSHEESISNFTAKLNRFKNDLKSSSDFIISQSIYEGQPDSQSKDFFLKRLNDLQEYKNFKEEFIKIISKKKLVSELDLRLGTFGVTIEKVSKDLHSKVIDIINTKLNEFERKEKDDEVLRTTDEYHRKNRKKGIGENVVGTNLVEGYTGYEYMDQINGKPKPTESEAEKSLRGRLVKRAHPVSKKQNETPSEQRKLNQSELQKFRRQDKLAKIERWNKRGVEHAAGKNLAVPPINITLSNIGNIGSGGQPGASVNSQSVGVAPSQGGAPSTTETVTVKKVEGEEGGGMKEASLKMASKKFAEEIENKFKEELKTVDSSEKLDEMIKKWELFSEEKAFSFYKAGVVEELNKQIAGNDEIELPSIDDEKLKKNLKSLVEKLKKLEEAKRTSFVPVTPTGAPEDDPSNNTAGQAPQHWRENLKSLQKENSKLEAEIQNLKSKMSWYKRWFGGWKNDPKIKELQQKINHNYTKMKGVTDEGYKKNQEEMSEIFKDNPKANYKKNLELQSAVEDQNNIKRTRKQITRATYDSDVQAAQDKLKELRTTFKEDKKNRQWEGDEEFTRRRKLNLEHLEKLKALKRSTPFWKINTLDALDKDIRKTKAALKSSEKMQKQAFLNERKAEIKEEARKSFENRYNKIKELKGFKRVQENVLIWTDNREGLKRTGIKVSYIAALIALAKITGGGSAIAQFLGFTTPSFASGFAGASIYGAGIGYTKEKVKGKLIKKEFESNYDRKNLSLKIDKYATSEGRKEYNQLREQAFNESRKNSLNKPGAQASALSAVKTGLMSGLFGGIFVGGDEIMGPIKKGLEAVMSEDVAKFLHLGSSSPDRVEEVVSSRSLGNNVLPGFDPEKSPQGILLSNYEVASSQSEAGANQIYLNQNDVSDPGTIDKYRDGVLPGNSSDISESGSASESIDNSEGDNNNTNDKQAEQYDTEDDTTEIPEQNVFEPFVFEKGGTFTDLLEQIISRINEIDGPDLSSVQTRELSENIIANFKQAFANSDSALKTTILNSLSEILNTDVSTNNLETLFRDIPDKTIIDQEKIMKLMNIMASPELPSPVLKDFAKDLLSKAETLRI